MISQEVALERLKKLKILFVDDEENILHLMTNLLVDLGVEFLTAKDGMEALEIIRKDESIDLVVSDYFMPNMDGMQMLEILRKEGNDIAFLFISGHQNMNLFDKADELGALEYLYKPFDFSQFVMLIGELNLK